MENEIVKSCCSRYILPYGKGIVILTAWEANDRFHCERFVVFEKSDGTAERRGLLTRISKADFTVLKEEQEDKATLTEFMGYEGKVMAEAEVFSIIVDLMRKMNRLADGLESDVTLYDSTHFNDLLYLKEKLPNEITWIANNTQCNRLKAVIKIVSQLTIEKSSY